MDRVSLEVLLGQGLSLAEIGRRFNRHESTIAYWVQKYRLEAVNRDKHTAKGALQREQLEPLVEAGMSIAQIAARLERSNGSVRRWLGQYGLVTQPRVARERRRAARTAQLSTVVDRCRHHGMTEHYLDGQGYYRCKRCRTEGVIRRRRRVKQLLVAEAGGRCRLCGYERCFGALQFHHLDPTTKRFGLSVRGLTPSIATLRDEARRCVLLCSNCHAEVEAGIVSVPV
ncbi:MAG TPA: helix-turn-helix domain-containing protein [Solirubrobacteraceae bacterium]|nr:helix-turn-helix domain-containing protein [Solirubrobacteraceae bacterium]